jgi:peptidoglycan-associated lipoprotein
MNQSLTYSLLACLILAGCSTAGKDAPIEERTGVAVTPSASAAAPTTAAPAGAAAGSAQAGAASQAGLAQGQVETRALPGSQAGVDGTAMAATQAAVGKNPLKDPASILSKRTIYFDFDSSAIRDEFRPLVEAHAQYLKDNKQAKTILQGHTDERGSREYNIALGQRRAESVSQAMTLLGVADAQIEAVSLGEEKPAAEGQEETAWAKNRRVEILYQGE